MPLKDMMATVSTWRKFLFQFAHEHIEFRVPEIVEVASLFGVDISSSVADHDSRNPFLVLDLPSEECARNITSRTVLVKSTYELWGQGRTIAELYKNMGQFPKELVDSYTGADQTYCIRVECFNKSVPLGKRITKIEEIPLELLPFEGKMKLEGADNFFHLLEYYGPQNTKPPDEPYVSYFGRWLANGMRIKVKDYHLTKRKFIGNTSMDAGLSFIMTNMGRVRQNSFVFDPFVGTGSLLISCAHFGAYVLGADIDWNIIHGRGKASRAGQKWRGPDDNILSNLKQYELQNHYIDALLADASLHRTWRTQPMFDAIITDPPYGVREPTQKVGSKKEDPSIANEYRDQHHPSRVSYSLSDILSDLLNFAAKYLEIGGRLVYWLPVYRSEYVEENVPRHPCLEIKANCEQPLNRRVARRLITMEKTKEFEGEELCAQTISDHYQDATFRDKYFRPPNWEEKQLEAANGTTDPEETTNS